MPLTSSLENDLKAVFSLRQARERVRWKGIYKRRRAFFLEQRRLLLFRSEK